MHRAALLAMTIAGAATLASPAHAQTAPTPPNAARPAPRPAATPPARPAPATALALPEPPIPAQHAAQAGITRCVPAVDQLARSALTSPYNAQSTWNQSNPSTHVFQSVAGVRNAKNNPPSGMVAIIAAPVATEGCDAVAVEVYPLAGTCADVQKLAAKGGETETSLEDIRVITDIQKRRLFLLPGYGNTCIAVSVNSFFGPP